MTSVEIVENIKRILVDPEGVTKERLAQLAYEYASRCRRIDAKLGRAIACIRMGQLSEAYRMETDGNVVAEFQTLTFDRVEEWQAVCRSLECDLAAQVSHENGTEFQLFIFEYEGAKELFDRSRRLALEGGNHKERLAILYQLQSKFPKCAAFERSIDELEAARVEEISDELKTIDKDALPTEFLQGAIAELQTPGRRNPPPAELLRNLKAWASYAQNAALTQSAREFLGVWASAKLSNDEAQALACLNKFRTGVYDAATPLLSSEERAALKVLAQHSVDLERRDAARVELRRKTRELSHASESMNDVDRLSHLMASAEIVAENAEQTVDPEIAAACSRRVESLQQQKNRQVSALIFALVAILLSLSAAVLVAFHITQSEREAKEAAAAIEEKLDAYERGDVVSLDAAQPLIEKDRERRPKLMDYVFYAEVVNRYDRLREEEDSRLAEFKRLGEQMKDSLKRETPINNLDAIKKLARRGKEKEFVNELEKRNKELLTRIEEAKSAENQARLEELTSAFNDVDGADPNQAAADCNNLLKRADSVRSLMAEDKAAAAELDALTAKIQATLQTALQNAASTDLSKTLRDSVGSVSAYSAVLNDLKENLAADESALADSASDDVANASRAQAWNTFVDKSGDVLIWAKNEQAFNEKSTTLDAGKESFSFAPEYKNVKTQVDAWKAFASDGGFDKTERDLRKAFDAYSTPTWTYYRVDTGTYAYLTAKPASAADKGVEQIAASGKKQKFSCVDLSEDEIKSIDETLPCKLCEELKKKTSDDFSDPKALVEYVLDVYKELVSAPKEKIDPTLKAKVVDDVLNCCAKCPGLQNLNARFAEERAAAELDLEFDVYSPGKDVRAKAQKVFDGLPDVNKAAIDASRDFFESAALNLPKYEWIGFIDDESAAPRITLGSGVDASKFDKRFDLYVARGDSSAAVKCGEIENGEPLLNSDKDWRSYRWTPVYRRDKPSVD